jgi:hypothetical protein
MSNWLSRAFARITGRKDAPPEAANSNETNGGIFNRSSRKSSGARIPAQKKRKASAGYGYGSRSSTSSSSSDSYPYFIDTGSVHHGHSHGDSGHHDSGGSWGDSGGGGGDSGGGGGDGGGGGGGD